MKIAFFGGHGMYKIDYLSPIGVIEITSDEQAIHTILFSEKEQPKHLIHSVLPSVLRDCYQQLEEYFAGTRKEFSIPYIVDGTAFQQDVWKALTTIAYGKTASYKDIAETIHREKAMRAVGAANGKNKLNIIIPCHRVIGANGNMTGYAGGLSRKKWLLDHEQTNIG